MNTRVFLSYRRSDSEGDAGRLYDAIKAQRPSWKVFIDVDEVTPGARYTTDIQRLVSSCHVLLAVIGPTWLTTTDERSGLPRILDPGDLLRLEVVTAFDSGLIVAPVLVRGAQVPRPSDVPAALERLVVLHATALRHTSFGGDVRQLIEGLDRGVAAGLQESGGPVSRTVPRWDPTTMPSVTPLGAGIKTRRFELRLFEGADPIRLEASGRYGDQWFTVEGHAVNARQPKRNHPLRRGVIGRFWFTAPDGIEHMIQVYVRLFAETPAAIIGVEISCDGRIFYQEGLT
jgi:hypothetical protein